MERERERDVILNHHIERILPNSFGLSNTVEGEPGYCRDHLEMREKDAGVLTEDTGRFGGSPRTPSLVPGAESPLECAPVPPECHSVTIRAGRTLPAQTLL